MGIFAPLLSMGNSPLTQDLAGRLAPPSADALVRHRRTRPRHLARTLYGARVTLTIVVLVSVIVVPIGLAVGTIAGYLGGWVDAVLMRITDIFLAFPRLILALAFAAALGPGIENAVIAISLTSWPPYARIARSETMTIARSDFIQAVVLQGASTWRILFRHIVPLCLSSVIVRLTLDMAGIILTAAGLGFLGLGAQPPTPEWGAMVSSGRDVILDQWWVATIPGLAIFIVSLGFNLLGDGLRDVFDPKSHMSEPSSPSTISRSPSRAAPASPARCAMPRSRWAASGSASSANRARARPRWAARCSASCRAPRRSRAKTMSYEGIDLLACTERDWQRLRGRRMSMVMQDPKYSLNPVKTVGKQIGETALPPPPDRPQGRRAGARSPCSKRCRSAIPSWSTASIRTSCPAAWASAS